MRRLLVVTMLSLILGPALPSAQAAVWRVTEGSEVVFVSKASIESFDGKTRQVRGHIACDLERLLGPLELALEVDLASLDTGIGLRNKHMRERHLETGKYPLAVFTAEEVIAASAAALAPGSTETVTVRGQFALHGVTHRREIAARVSLAAGGVLTVTADFPVKLSDHDISRPTFLVLRLADEQQVAVRLVMAPEAP
ncbi:MAG: YceI family protein [Candidatus Krumholzibacteria bacterium]|jgi:polyisoprenoid-binding protein YceI|nr:YceI family protein [Candidatus Krumholzibacteria bacterium]